MLRWILFLVALALSACGGNAPTPPGPGPTPELPEPVPPALTLSGTAGGYEGPEGVLTATFANKGAEVATAPIAADGGFTLELPGEVPASSLATSETYTFCEDNPVEVSISDWKADLILELAVTQVGAEVGSLVLSNLSSFADAESLVGLQFVNLVYTDAPLTVQGVCNDAELGGPLTYEMPLQTGWNYVVQEVTEAEGAVPTAATLRTVPELPSDVQWGYLPSTVPFGTFGRLELPRWRLAPR